MKRYFITGTDTDCGKTYVTCQLLSYLNGQQKKAQALKPLASGCKDTNGEIISEDVAQLQRHNADPQLLINYRRYLPPISPHLAARQEGEQVSVQDLAEFCNESVFSDFDYVLIEGAGGLCVPINDQETWFDFLILTKMPVILVVGIRLGCINHALLTDFFISRNKINCLGWIANCLDPNMLQIDENIATLSAKMSMPLLTILNYCGNIKLINNLV